MNGGADEDVRVVVVDDQSPFRDAAAAVLDAMAGFSVVGSAATGEEALVLARSLRPDLVVLDVSLPGLSGVEVARRLARDQAAAVVVLVSTYEEAELGDEVSQCGAAGYLRKSDFGPELLRELLGGVRGRSQR